MKRQSIFGLSLGTTIVVIGFFYPDLIFGQRLIAIVVGALCLAAGVVDWLEYRNRRP